MISSMDRNVFDSMPGSRDCDSQSGIALIMVLWVLAILMVIVFSFSFMVKSDTLSTLSFKGGNERRLLAEAGLERAIMELVYRNTYKDQTVELEGREVWKTDGTPYTGKLGSGYYTVRITDESGKIDINKMTDSSAIIFKGLLTNLGVSGSDADIVADSIMDWRDADDFTRIHGAESDYYQSLQNPYKAKNADFETLEELLLVKGVTPEILYGSNNKKGLIDFITIWSNVESVNVNAAPKEVLAALPNMTPEIAEAIITYRQNKEIKGIEEIQGIVGGNYQAMAQYISVSGTDVFTIDSSGGKENEKGVYAIRATVMLTTGTDEKTHTFIYYKSPVAIKQ
jgi:general secretion pathway protein K